MRKHRDPDHVLREMLPGVTVVGRDFADALPDPSTVAPSERASVLRAAQRVATDGCVRDAMELAGAGAIDVRSCPDGPRDWPAGIVGSVSHKGTFTVVAVARAASWAGLGIDLEQLDQSDMSVVRGLGAGELPPGPLEHAEKLQVVFAVKEAVFKAVFPLARRRVGFDEIQPREWASTGLLLRARADLHGRGVRITAATTGPWILASAIVGD